MLLPRLADEHPRVREHAVRFAEKLPRVGGDSRAACWRWPAIPSCASGIRLRFRSASCRPVIAAEPGLGRIAKRDAADGYVRVAVLSSLGEGAGEVLALLAGDPEYRANKAGCEIARQPGHADRQAAASRGRGRNAEGAWRALAKENSPLFCRRSCRSWPPRKATPLAEQVAAATGGKAEALMQALLDRSRCRCRR